VLRADSAAVKTGAPALISGARAVTEQFSGRARAAKSAAINGAPGAVWSMGGKPRVVFSFTIEADRIVGIDRLAEPETLAGLDPAIL
jgi:hypothetical protein